MSKKKGDEGYHVLCDEVELLNRDGHLTERLSETITQSLNNNPHLDKEDVATMAAFALLSVTAGLAAQIKLGDFRGRGEVVKPEAMIEKATILEDVCRAISQHIPDNIPMHLVEPVARKAREHYRYPKHEQQ